MLYRFVMAVDFLQVNFRMPADLKSQLEAEATRSGRTTTAEIVHRLRKSLEAPTDELAYLRQKDRENEEIINRLTGMVQQAGRKDDSVISISVGVPIPDDERRRIEAVVRAMVSHLVAKG